MPSRKEILEKAAEITGGEREDTYGGPEQSFELIAGLWTTYLDYEITATDVAAMMALLKIACLRRAPDHLDSWIDLAGYAACGGEIGAATTSVRIVDQGSDLPEALKPQAD